MTSFVEVNSVTPTDDINTVHRHCNSDISYRKNSQCRLRHVLKPKENYYKLKCNKLLKKKLKKYKLRQDGTEDQDVLDVSKILVSSLIIKSPNNNNDHLVEECEFIYGELKPKNYLFNMVSRKESIKTAHSVNIPSKHVKHNEMIDIPDATPTEKKHTNAFQLLMDSRNKTIGSNSPGKEKSDNQSDNEDVLEKKNIKVKRKLLLEKMAVAKGHQKNKEMEEYQDKIIKKKMNKRAERLKTMILKETKPATLNEIVSNKKEAAMPKLNLKDQAESLDNNKVNKKSKAFTIVDIFNTLNDPVHVSPKEKLVRKEDEEFLKKLSPSLRKKESMLSYFKKVDKESESPVDSENDNLIKVKLRVKTKKRGKKKKLSLKKNIEFDDVVNVNDENDVIASKTNIPLPEILPVPVDNLESQSEIQKRKKTPKTETMHSSEAIVLNNDVRPKRSIKRPIKYSDDACMSSSDEELHIFTPKKKKILGSSNDKVTVNTKSEHVAHLHTKPLIENKVKEETITIKKSVKLAPIFATKQLNSAALEAKQKFLQSGVPDKLKKIIQHHKSDTMINSDFTVVVHVQQLHTDIEKVIPLQPNILHESIDDICPLNVSDIEKDAYKKLLNLNKVPHAYNIDTNLRKSTQTVLQNIKQIHPKFPVYRTYRYFRGKRKGELKNCIVDCDNSIEVTNDEVDAGIESPDKLNWTDKYKAMSTNQIIGNFESIKELRKWLISWSENEIKSKSRGNAGSDSSDYYQSETDSRDSLKTMNNLLILTGPTGCGKTSSVYAVAAELAIKVIEVNASSKRTGKIMLQDLQEATQSHKVNRGTSTTDNSQKSQEKNLTEQLKKKKKKGRPKKITEKSSKNSSEKIEILSSTPSSQESTRTAMSLILIDDADIIFDQDDGFTSAIVQLVQCSKRPVILITSSLVCPHLQRFVLSAKILKLSPLLPGILGTWLDIMCLADSGVSWPGLGAKFLNYFNGDIRKTVNYLQFYISSYANSSINDEDSPAQNTDYEKVNIDDENSNMSWADHVESEERKLTPVAYNNIDSNSIWTDFIDRHLNLFTIQYPIQLFSIWWSVPRLLSSVPIIPNTNALTSKVERPMAKELEAIADVIDAISLSDYITHIRPDASSDITAGPWYSSESDSVSEQDNIDYYMNKYEVGDEICHTLVTGCISAAQDILKCDKRTEMRLPGMSLQRERDKVVTRHKSLTSYLSPWATLDRRSLALDYWSSCRSICRIEKSKSDAHVNVKRNNRFCHYLKSVSVLCKSDAFDNLCDSLSEQGTELKVSNFNE